MCGSNIKTRFSYIITLISHVHMYADDSMLQAHAKDIKTVENKLTEILAKTAEWMKNNKLIWVKSRHS